jgi:hypothetical protein
MLNSHDKISLLMIHIQIFLNEVNTMTELERHNTCLNLVSQHIFKPWYKPKISTWRMEVLLILPKNPSMQIRSSDIKNKTSKIIQINRGTHWHYWELPNPHNRSHMMHAGCWTKWEVGETKAFKTWLNIQSIEFH